MPLLETGADLRSLLTEAQVIAVVGHSDNPERTSYRIAHYLREAGYTVYPVNPNADQINGDKCYASLAELSGKVDGVVICVPPQKSAQVLRDAAAAGINKVWLQQGSQSVETGKVARELGISPVEGKCILMYAGEVKSIHAFHKFFAKLFGSY